MRVMKSSLRQRESSRAGKDKESAKPGRQHCKVGNSLPVSSLCAGVQVLSCSQIGRRESYGQGSRMGNKLPTVLIMSRYRGEGMRSRSLFLLMLGAVMLTGCRDSAPSEDFTGEFELSTEIVFEHHWAVVQRVKIRGQGSRTVSLGSGQGGLGGVNLSPDPQSTCEVIVLAMVDPGRRSFMWWATVNKLQDGKRVSGGAGAPQTFPVARDKSAARGPLHSGNHPIERPQWPACIRNDDTVG